MAASRIKVKQSPPDMLISPDDTGEIPWSMNPIERSCLSRKQRSLDKQSMPLLASKFFNL